MIDGDCILTVTRSKLIKYRGPFKALDGISAKEFLLSMLAKNPVHPHDIRLTIRLNFKPPTPYQLNEERLKINSHNNPDIPVIPDPLCDQCHSNKLRYNVTTDGEEYYKCLDCGAIKDIKKD